MGQIKLEQKPRLLIILNRFVIGGQAVDTIPLAFELTKDFEVLILFGEKEKDEIEPEFLLNQYPGLRLKKIPQLRRSINPLIDFLAFFRLLITISQFRADIVHTHGAKSGFLGRLAAFFSGVPIIVHTFHGHFFHSYFSPAISRTVAWVEKIIGKITTSAIALSATQKNDLVYGYKILPAHKIHVIPLGFQYNSSIDAQTLRSGFRNKYGLQENDVAIGIVGRIVPVKNHNFFVEIIKSYQQRFSNSNVAFFIIGDGGLKSKVEALLLENKITYNNLSVNAADRVVFTSWLQQMDEVMNGLDIVVLTSLNEGTPLSMIEAQYFEKPVISTNVGGVKDTMIDGATGFLVESDCLKEFVEKMNKLINSKVLRQEFGIKGKEFVKSKFSKANEIERTKEFYFSLLLQKGIA